MAEYPSDLRYTSDHEWVKLDGDRARVGITEFAQESLGDIVFISLPAEGDQVEAGEECGEIESTKSVSPLISPISGTVVAVNAELDDAPETVNSDPYGKGWMIEIGVSGEDALEGTLTAEEYRAQLD